MLQVISLRACIARPRARSWSASALKWASEAFAQHGWPDISELARRTGHLRRLIIFGSYITAKRDPNDVDVVLVMDDAFRLEECRILELRALFDHALAQARYGVSIFWIRPGMLMEETVEEFVVYTAD